MLRHAKWALATFAMLGVPHVALANGQRDPVQAKVKVNDLDLENPAGRRTAAQRVKAAAGQMCNPGETDARNLADGNRCQQEMRSDGAQQVSDRVDAARRRRSRVEIEQARAAAAAMTPPPAPIAAPVYRRAPVHHVTHRRVVHRRYHHRVVRHRRPVHRTH